MKKIITTGYFVVILFLSYASAKTIAVLKNGDVEYYNNSKTRTLSDTECVQLGFEKKDDKNVKELIKIRETRTKSFWGWDTKKDTVYKGYYYTN